MAAPMMQTDKVLRSMTNDGSYRVLVVDATETVRAVIAAQDVSNPSRRAVAAVVTSAVLIRETMAPANRVQVIYSDDAGNQLVGDAFPEGNTRGLARIADEILGVRTEAGGAFQVERMIRASNSNKGIVEVQNGEDMSAALHRYFKQSEQVESIVDLAYCEHDGAVTAACGYVVQLLPELTDPPRAAMQARLAAFGALREHARKVGPNPEKIMAQLLADTEYTLLEDSPVQFHCPCNRQRVMTATTALGREELLELQSTGEELTITCDYCAEKYVLGAADYAEILKDS